MSDLHTDLSPNIASAAPIAAFTVRAAIRKDITAIADLLLEGFGHEYGGILRQGSGRRFIERVHALPGRLNGMVVAVDQRDVAIGVAGLRTRELRLRLDGGEQQVMFEELGVGPSILLDLREGLMAPPPYQPAGAEAYLYSVSVTQAWRGRGVGDALLEFLHAQAHALGKARVLLEVVSTNQPALRLYERHGYTLVRRRRGPLGWIPLLTPPLLLLQKQL
jgi:ribosomal protein S18 acetylase RimI-like enzyme